MEETSVGFDLNQFSVLIRDDRAGWHIRNSCFGSDRKFELSPCNLMTGIRPEGGTAEEKGDVQEILRTRFRCRRKREGDLDGFRCLRFCFQRRKHSRLDRLSIFRDIPGDG